MTGWYGVDFDGTLAKYISKTWPLLGEPIPSMLERVKQMLAEGKEVRIVTARANMQSQINLIKDWLEENGLPRLDVTNKKDHEMIELWDDRVIQLIKNTGIIATEEAYDRGYNEGYSAAERDFKRWLEERT